MFEWSDIRIFLAIVDSGSTLGASRTLGINQTTVSRRVQSLEHALGLTLFERDTRGYSVTSNGKAFLDLARQMADAANQISKQAKVLKRGAVGKIRISAAADCQAYWVNPIISAYKSKREDITFEVDDVNHQVDLTKGEADLAIRATDQILDENLIARKLGSVVWAAYCSKSYLENHSMPRSFEDLTDHNVAFYSDRMIDGINMLQDISERFDTAQITHTFNSTVSLSNMLEEGNALGFLPRITGHARPELVECFTDDMFRQTVWLVTSNDAYKVPRVREFMKFIGDFGLKDGVTLV